VGRAGGFRQPVAFAALENDVHRGGQADPVADGDEQRPHPGPGAQHHADGLAAVLEGGRVALVRPRLRVGAHQPALGGADGGQAGEHAQMTSQAEAPRVGDALGVTDHQIRDRGELLQRCHDRRHFPERQVAGHIRKVDPAAHRDLLEQLAVGKAEQRRRGPHPVAAALDADVQARHAFDPVEMEVVAAHHPPAQRELQGFRCGDASRPGMGQRVMAQFENGDG